MIILFCFSKILNKKIGKFKVRACVCFALPIVRGGESVRGEILFREFFLCHCVCVSLFWDSFLSTSYK